MNTKTLFVDIQGFKNAENEFIVKELALATSEYTQVFLIKPPYPYRYLTEVEKKRVQWIENNLGYRWGEGHVDFLQFKSIIKPYLQNKLLIVKGLEKVKWLKELCENCAITNIEEKGCPNLKQLFEMFKSYLNDFTCIIHKSNCALRNVLCIKKWFKDNQITM